MSEQQASGEASTSTGEAKVNTEHCDMNPMQELAQTLAEALKQSAAASPMHSDAAVRNVRAPRVYSVGQNFKTWLSQFMQYIALVKVKEADRKAYLLTLLDQPAYRAVELLRLPEELSFAEFTERLSKRFDSGKSKEDYKLQLRARKQRPNEDTDSFADCLMEMVQDNAYPEAAYTFKVELARDQFIHGVEVTDDIRERLFMKQPETLTDAVRCVHQMESARKACKSGQPAGKSRSVNAVAPASDDKAVAEIRALKELVLGMNQKIQDLERKVSERPARLPRRADVECFSCHERGHYARECPSRVNTRPGNGQRSLPRGNQAPQS